MVDTIRRKRRVRVVPTPSQQEVARMKAIAPEGLQCSSTSDGSNVSEIVDSFVEATADLAEALDAPESVVTDFVEAGEELGDLVEETAHNSTQARERARENETEIAEARDESARERAEIKQRVHALEENEKAGSGDANPAPEDGETALHEPETPLEEVIQIPEHSAEENLSANQKRARFVAKDVNDYTKSVPAGKAITSGELRRVLTAREESKVHTETVGRVISFLDDLGKGSVKVRETQAGERVVVFTEKIVRRITAFHDADHTRCDRRTGVRVNVV